MKIEDYFCLLKGYLLLSYFYFIINKIVKIAEVDIC